MMPAMAGAIPYGHRRSERYSAKPRILAFASAASRSASAKPANVTANEKTKLVTSERKDASSRNRRSKLVSPTKMRRSPNGDARYSDNRSESKAGQKKNTTVITTCGATRAYGSQRFGKTLRFTYRARRTP